MAAAAGPLKSVSMGIKGSLDILAIPPFDRITKVSDGGWGRLLINSSTSFLKKIVKHPLIIAASVRSYSLRSDTICEEGMTGTPNS